MEDGQYESRDDERQYRVADDGESLREGDLTADNASQEEDEERTEDPNGQDPGNDAKLTDHRQHAVEEDDAEWTPEIWIVTNHRPIRGSLFAAEGKGGKGNNRVSSRRDW